MRPSLPSLLRLQQTIIFVALCLSIPSWPQAANVAPGSIVSTPPDVTYFAVQGDTLSAIAKRFTDKLQNWHILGRRNKITDDRAIPIGTAIVIPLELLPEEDSEAKVIAMAGSPTAKPVNGDEVPLSVGAILKEGAQIVTGKNGFLTLSLSDDSRVSIPSNSQVSLTKLRKTQFTGSPRTQISLIQGKIESRVTSLISNKGRFEVRSPLAIAGVRGTHFRVGVNKNGTANEVLTGGVAVEKSDQKKSDGLLLTAGKGNIIGVSGVGQAVDLLPPPTMETRYQLQEHPTVVFNVNTSPAAKGYRVQIANDEAMQDVIAENRFTQNRFKFEGLSDGQYYVRITAIDTLGLEGLPLVSSFRLKARPEPPFSVEPKNKVRADHVDFSWTQASNAQSYHLQVAKDANFSQIVLDQADITAVQLAGIKLPLGNYFWRVATIATTKTGKDQGPYGDTTSFAMLPAQTISPIKDTGGSQLSFSWSSEPGQKFLIQISQDEAFRTLYLNKNLDQAELKIPRPEAGRYFIRVRSIDADGYTSAFSSTQSITILPRWTTGNGEPVSSDGGVVGTNF